jgi:uncharacterized protein (TIGR02284 family)
MQSDLDTNVIEVLSDLVQLDVDATYAYEQALKQIDDKKIYADIEGFRDDHLRHIDELSALIKELGGTPPDKSRDLKGFVIEGFTALRSVTGTKGALSAMEGNEKLTNKNYQSAIDDNPDFSTRVMNLLKKNYGDEQRHLHYIQSTLKKLS